MKVFSAKDTKAIDQRTIKEEPITSIRLMESAAFTFCDAFLKQIPSGKLNIVCGKGNNGGDGLAIARILHLRANFDIIVHIVHFTDKESDDFKINHERLKAIGQIPIKDCYGSEDFELESDEMIIDALWGSGLDRPVEGFAREIIKAINASGSEVFAIDLPSGVFCDRVNFDKEGIVKANYTYTFQFPKPAFFFPEYEENILKWNALNIGLSERAIEETNTPFYINEIKGQHGLFKPRTKFSHKGTFSHVLIVGGSMGSRGAPLLSAHAALRSGAGLVSLHIPICGYNIAQTALPEAMVQLNEGEKSLKPNLKISDFSKFDVFAIGPGMGKSQESYECMKEIFSLKASFVIDADALNLLAEQKDWEKQLPKHSILTPHPGEFDRLFGPSEDHRTRIEKAMTFCKKHKKVLVLKGAYTAIIGEKADVYFNTTGNPGMATAGSGDTLTGIIASLLAQGYSMIEAARIGVYVHGLAGDLSIKNSSEHALIARDIIKFLGKAFRETQA